MDAPRDFTTAMMSSRSRFMVFHHHLLVVAALGARERSYLSGAVGRHDGGLVPVEYVAALLASLPEGHDRAPLVYELAARHLYRHSASERVARLRHHCMPI